MGSEMCIRDRNEDGRIKDVSKEGSTGSPIEDEANSMAGRLMRWFGKANPDKFALSHIVEEYTSTLSAYSPQGKNSKTREMEGGYAAARPGPGQDPKKPESVKKSWSEGRGGGRSVGSKVVGTSRWRYAYTCTIRLAFARFRQSNVTP